MLRAKLAAVDRVRAWQWGRYGYGRRGLALSGGEGLAPAREWEVPVLQRRSR